jgi:hypothetical protein
MFNVYICDQDRNNPKRFGDNREWERKIHEQYKKKRTGGKYLMIDERKIQERSEN